jgi:hypothetical protein
MGLLNHSKYTFSLVAEACERGCPHQSHFLFVLLALNGYWLDLDVVDILAVFFEGVVDLELFELFLDCDGWL